uniref:Ig-like domain-containing protein n=1 Tax=Varanus komodoensis TaxID=61221 RepID=A0A8D2J6Y6_VARKO
MAWALLFWALLNFCAGKVQAPNKSSCTSMSLGQPVKLSCTGSGGGDWYFSWVQQPPGQRPQFMLHGSSRGEGIPNRFSGSNHRETPNYLTITNVQAVDEADCFCASWVGSSSVSHGGLAARNSREPRQTDGCTIIGFSHPFNWPEKHLDEAPTTEKALSCVSTLCLSLGVGTWTEVLVPQRKRKFLLVAFLSPPPPFAFLQDTHGSCGRKMESRWTRIM